MHILILSYFFPPARAVGGLRPARLADALVAAGHQVTVVTACPEGEPPATRHRAPGLRVRTVPSPQPIRAILANLKSRVVPAGAGPGSPAGKSNGETPGGTREHLGQRAKRWLYSALWTPDDLQRFILPARRAAREVHEANPVDLLYSTAPPFSIHLAAGLIAADLGRPWVAEFRDPWTDVPRGADTRSLGFDRVEMALERWVLRRADEVVAVTASIAGGLARKRLEHRPAGTVLVSYNGIPTTALPPVIQETGTGPIDILHAGTLYLHRDPRPFLHALAAGIQRGAFGGRPVRLTLLGANADDFLGLSVREMASSLGIGDCLRVEGHLAPDACLERMTRATALLLLAQNQPQQVPNKLFDYLAAGRPIIALADQEGESAAILHRVGGHFVIDPGEAGMEEAVIAAVRQCGLGPPDGARDHGYVRELSTTVQLQEVVALVERAGKR